MNIIDAVGNVFESSAVFALVAGFLFLVFKLKPNDDNIASVMVMVLSLVMLLIVTHI